MAPAQVFLNIGFAGCGKSAFTNAIKDYGATRKLSVYVINLDPAVSYTPYESDLDIRDTIDYGNVMKTYKLGPNGAISTSLALFATKLDQISDILEENIRHNDYVIIDTPGQIEIFTWSASGELLYKMITEVCGRVGSHLTINYVMDVVKCQTPSKFVSTILHLCSIYYRYNCTEKGKTRFQMIFNKSDKIGEEGRRIIECYLSSEDELSFALDAEKESFNSVLYSSISSAFEILYSSLPYFFVSSTRAHGVEDTLNP